MAGMLGVWKSRLVIRRARLELERIARQYCPSAKVSGIKAGKHLTFRIATKTDAERDQIRVQPNLYRYLCSALAQAGYPPNAIPSIHFRIESQETVDRDYGGSWVEEAEMP